VGLRGNWFAETEKARRGFGTGAASAASPTRRCEENDEGPERGGRKRVDD
jgi:hypothetical protein